MLAKCPSCDGVGLKWRETYYLHCDECNGVGQIYVGAEPSGRQLLYGAILFAVAAIALILMFASKL